MFAAIFSKQKTTTATSVEDGPLFFFITKISTFIEIIEQAEKANKPSRINAAEEAEIRAFLHNLTYENYSEREKRYKDIQENIHLRRDEQKTITHISQNSSHLLFQNNNSLRILFTQLVQTPADTKIIEETHAHIEKKLKKWAGKQLNNEDTPYLSLSELEENLCDYLRPYLSDQRYADLSTLKRRLESIHDYHWLDFIKCIEAKKANCDGEESLMDNSGNELLMDYLEIPDDDRPFMGL